MLVIRHFFRLKLGDDNIQLLGRGNLFISSVLSNMNGLFKCTARNQNGQVQASTAVNVKRKQRKMN